MLKTNLPVLFLKNHEIFPYCETKLEFSDINLKKTVSLAENIYDSCLIVIHQKNGDTLENLNNINIGILAKVSFKIDMPNGNMRISLKGLNRVIINSIKEEESVYDANISILEKNELDPIEEIAMSRTLKKSLDGYIELTETNIFDNIKDIHDIDKLTDIVANLLEFEHNRKLKYLKEKSVIKRLEMLLDDIEYEKSIIKIEDELNLKVNHELDKGQKEYFLKEKLKIIKDELGENENEYLELQRRINNLDAPKEIKKRLELELNRYKSCNNNSPEIGIIRNYIDILLSLPWNKSSKEEFDPEKIRKILESTHFGLEETKERIIEHIMVRHQKTGNLPILCLVGPPGVGKTSIAASIARALNLKCVKISVGGVNDEAEIIGHRRTYVGAAPGKIMSSIQKVGVNNPVFIIDEVDKMTKDIKGDPASALLEVLDKEQNNRFVDHFIDEEFDLSKVMFILTANYLNQIPDELKDRMEIINISSYTEYEKIKIANNYIIPKLKKEYKLEQELLFSKKTLVNIIRSYTKESGVREFTRVLDKIFRKYVCLIIDNKELIDPNNNIEYYLGAPKYQSNINSINSKGVVTGLAYTPFGGEIVKIETMFYPGKELVKITGQVGDIMEESINVALGYIKGNYKNFNLNINYINNNTLHMHLPSNAIKKDGPSAGITIVTSILSFLKNKEISNKISMSGEISLTGKILKVGGIKEKIIAAINNNIAILFLPLANKEEVQEISYIYNKKIRIAFVSNYNEIYQILFNK